MATSLRDAARNALLKLYVDRLKERDHDGFLARHEDADLGDAGGIETVYGRRVSLDFLQSVDEALRIRETGREPEVIVELGAGSGRLGYVCRKMFPGCTFAILDLPEPLFRAHAFLSWALPDDVVSYESARNMPVFDRATLRKGRLWLLGTQHIERFADDCADVFVNLFNLAEMPPAASANYLRQIDRVTSGVVLTKERQGEADAGTYVIPSRWRELYRETATLYETFFEAAYATRGSEGKAG